MLFGVICMYVMAYGAYTLFDGVVSPFIPARINKIVTYVEVKTAEINVSVMMYKHGEGMFDAHHEIVLADYCPILVGMDVDNELKQEDLYCQFVLTDIEKKDLDLMLESLTVFETWGQPLRSVPEAVKKIQRIRMVRPIQRFLDQIPPERR